LALEGEGVMDGEARRGGQRLAAQDDVYEHLPKLIALLRTVATAHSERTLTHLLDMAALEAEQIRERRRNLSRRRPEEPAAG
jgi:hypothetical protein